MPETINQILRAELEQIGRHTERYYIEIDSDTHGTLKLCQRGETVTDAFDWIESVNGFHDGGGQVQDVSFILSSEAESRVATEPLENHVCRLYIYRDSFDGKHHVRTGRVWSDTTESGSENVFVYRIIGDLATALTGYLPERTFKGEGIYGYYQIPEGDKGAAIPLVIGSVDGWTPKLCKAGGWGYLSENLPAYSAPWTGEIKLLNNRGASFMAPGLQTTLTSPITSKTASAWWVASTAAIVRDWKWFWVIAYQSSSVWEIARADGFSAAHIGLKYRGAIGQARDTFAVGDAVYEISLVKIDNEIIAYRRSTTGALMELLRGVNGEPSAHVKGARVQEYLPTLYWMVNAKPCAVNGLKLNEIYFYDSSTNSLISNPFPDMEIRRTEIQTEPGQTVSAIRLHSQFGSQAVGCNAVYTASNTSSEDIGMDTISAENDDTVNWTNPAYAIDGDPDTSADYVPIITDEDFYLTDFKAIYGDWFNLNSAIDGDIATCAGVEREAGWPSMRIDLSIRGGSTPTDLDQIYIVWACAYAYWTGQRYAGIYTDYNYDQTVITMIPSANWQQVVIFGDSYTGEYNLEHANYFRSTAAYNNGGDPQLSIAFAGITDDIVASTAYIAEFKLILRKTSQSNLKTRNTGTVTNKAQTKFTNVEMYLASGEYEIKYGSSDWYPIIGYGNTIPTRWTIPGSDAWTADSDWQQWIYLRPRKRDMTVKVYEIKLVNYYTNYGNWVQENYAIDGSDTTYAIYNAATGGFHYGEFYRNTAVNSMATIKRVRIKITYLHNLDTMCRVGIGAASGGSTPPGTVIWHDISPATTKQTIYVDVTEDNTAAWSWNDFNTTGSGRDYSIYLKLQGTNGKHLYLYEIAWDITTALSQVDPLQQPLVVNCSGVSDVIGGGIYTESGGVICNPADVEVFLLQDQKHISSDKIDLAAYRRLRDYFDGLCVNGVKAATVLDQKTATDEWLRSYRKEFGYHVDEVRGKLTPRYWPPAATVASESIIEDHIDAGSFRRWQTGMEEVINAPVIYYNKSFYNSDRSKTVLSQIRQKVPLIRRKLGSLFDAKYDSSAADTTVVYRDILSVSDWIQEDDAGNDWNPYYLLATKSYQAYGDWFESILELQHVRDAESARAIGAEILRRYTLQRWKFSFNCDPRIADRIATYDVVYLTHRVIPIIPGKVTYSAHAELGTIRTAKVVVLSIVPNGRWRVMECEVL